MPLKRRVPKRGFRNPFKKRYALVHLRQLEVFDPGSDVSLELLHDRGLVRKKDAAVKILGDGSLSKPLTVRAHRFSARAKEKIESVGGRAEVISNA